MRKYADVRIDLTVPNREVTEPRQTHCADPDCTGPKPHVAETTGCKWGNPRAASDDEVEWQIAALAYERARDILLQSDADEFATAIMSLLRAHGLTPRAASDDEVVGLSEGNLGDVASVGSYPATPTRERNDGGLC